MSLYLRRIEKLERLKEATLGESSSKEFSFLRITGQQIIILWIAFNKKHTCE